MKTITLEKPGSFRLHDTAAPVLDSSGEAIVKIHRVGICGTDLHAYRGKQPFFSYPRILGHELGVEVVAVDPNDRGLKAGDRCAVLPSMTCGRCIACRRGKPQCCMNIRVLGVHMDGGMRELLKVPVAKLFPSTELSFDQLALVETLGIGSHAVQRGQIEPDETVLVIGAGPIGLSVIQFVKVAGARTIVLDINEDRLRFCREKIGIEHTILDGPETVAELKKLTSDELPTTVIDATGNPASMTNAFRYIAHGGKLVFVGVFQGDLTFNDPDFHRRETTLMACRNSQPQDFERIVSLMEAGRLDTTPWITHRCTSDEMIERFPSWLEPSAKVLKAVVSF
ncbi:MAG TPA: zinc-binding alcohol dehydrogenase family protein [Planctomycetota bacterium]|jgi:2-desacetyl-2-hydroxyethyl bacteriochlorophyllide A dehydrogenase